MCGTSDVGVRGEGGTAPGIGFEPLLICMDRLADEMRQEAPWTIMFTDDIVIVARARTGGRGMKVNRRKTEYMCVNDNSNCRRCPLESI